LDLKVSEHFHDLIPISFWIALKFF
jgi:hypothetical protein